MIKTEELRAHLRRVALESFTQTWQSSGGVDYRKRPAQRQIDQVRFAEACKIAADYLTLDGCHSPDALRARITAALVAEGVLVEDARGGLTPRAEADRDWVLSLPLRSLP